MDDFLTELQQALIQLKPDEQAEVLDYYREYLQEANLTTYQACVDELGTPRSLARKTLADYSIRLNDQFVDTQQDKSNHHRTAKNNLHMSWLIILALLSTPITIPLLMALLLLLGALMLVIGAMVFSVIAIFGGSLVAAGSLIVAGFGVLNASLWTTVFYVGCGLTIIGILLMIFPVVEWIIVKMVAGLAQILKWTYYRFVRRNRVQKGVPNHEKDV